MGDNTREKYKWKAFHQAINSNTLAIPAKGNKKKKWRLGSDQFMDSQVVPDHPDAIASGIPDGFADLSYRYFPSPRIITDIISMIDTKRLPCFAEFHKNFI